MHTLAFASSLSILSLLIALLRAQPPAISSTRLPLVTFPSSAGLRQKVVCDE